MTSPGFRRHKGAGKWESGWTAVPNKLIQDTNLTEPAFRLLVWMESNTPNWEIYQKDIMRRFQWGKEKMKAAIDNLIEFKYLVKLPQKMLPDGRYGPCDYEFTVQGFTEEEIKEIQINSPMAGFPISVEPTSGNQASEQDQVLTTLIKKQQQQETEPTARTPQAVVVSSDSDEEEEVDFQGLKIPDSTKDELIKNFGPSKLQVAISRTMATPGRANDAAMLRHWLNKPETWIEPNRGHDPQEDAGFLAKLSRLNDQVINGVRIVVGYNYVELIRGPICERHEAGIPAFEYLVLGALKRYGISVEST